MIKKLIITTLIVVSAFTASTFGCSEYIPPQGMYHANKIEIIHNNVWIYAENIQTNEINRFCFILDEHDNIMDYVDCWLYYAGDEDMVALYNTKGVCFYSDWD